ncbi:type II toxin-antitoxin system VapC family toxin [Mycobacterium sp. CBMA293]|nr:MULTISPECIES: type II toxin-antitoxin system VapC family toxin [unclassified Mycolicibacterium]MUL60856.1 type II toxin-antitoxin system VapC family toxin [Mycolicibacterium sp. CBMA 335]MUL71869.1 type II toxin-antitoxin system VapC family toxin [Mycolicibacterium sp. CBMA 311]MUM06395.1 twitching motility protein PilT [Mycolicibacterium sp. CBMA 213]MUM13184.1 type II toxin-antitoxin system VapC family toxin [Mycolicibacterium sp. CBMA 293]MUL48646.1 type II toxin-antitoxin system VapC fa
MREGYLLDTHVLLWLLTEPARLSDAAQRLLGDSSNQLYVSAASAWEIATKNRLGKLPLADSITMSFQQHLRRAAVETIDISPDHAILGGAIGWVHRDPFDRVIAATAMVEGIALVSSDPVFDGLNGLRVVW